MSLDIQMYPSMKLVNPFDLRIEEIDINDIAHHLSMICRWGGGTPGFYSVAEHSVRVAAKLPDKLKLWGLLHDAAEAYLGDHVRPMKCRTYFSDQPYDETGSTYSSENSEEIGISGLPVCVIEDEILEIVAHKYNLPFPIPEQVLKADDECMKVERARIADGTLIGNNPRTAEKIFLYALRQAQELANPTKPLN